MSDLIEIVDYDPRWPDLFRAYRVDLAAALGPSALRIDHVGSTAVPGLAAKPVIDIQVAVPDQDDLDSYQATLEATGLRLHYLEPGWSMFQPTGERTRHVHVTTAGSPREREQRLFVAYLRTFPERRDGYAALKRELAARFRDDRDGYTMAKSAFVAVTLALAAEWAAAEGWS